MSDNPLVPPPDEPTGRIVIVVDLPQPIDKINMLLTALGEAWPGSTVNARPRQRLVPLNGGSIVEIHRE